MLKTKKDSDRLLSIYLLSVVGVLIFFLIGIIYSSNSVKNIQQECNNKNGVLIKNYYDGYVCLKEDNTIKLKE